MCCNLPSTVLKKNINRIYYKVEYEAGCESMVTNALSHQHEEKEMLAALLMPQLALFDDIQTTVGTSLSYRN